MTALRSQFSETVTLPIGPGGSLVPVEGVATTIYNLNPDGTEGTQATAYQSITGSTVASSLVTDVSGSISYYLDQGQYNIHFDDQQTPPRIASFVREFSSITLSILQAIAALNPVNTDVNLNAVAQSYINADVVASPIVITLPAPSVGSVIGIIATGNVTPVNFVSVVASGSAVIEGLGLNGVASLRLGALGAKVLLESLDGTNWQVIDGSDDSGWLPLPLPANWGTPSGDYVPALRKIADRVFVRGVTQNNTGGAATLVPTALPLADMTPSLDVVMSTTNNSFGVYQLAVTSSGGLGSSGATPNGGVLYLDGLGSYSLS